jgi:hypothetical protein
VILSTPVSDFVARLADLVAPAADILMPMTHPIDETDSGIVGA